MEIAPAPEQALHRLEHEQNIWFGSVRPDGRPHLAPVWFVWHAGKIYIGADPKSVKSRNIQRNPRVTLALEEGTHPLICEGVARVVDPPWEEDLLAAFFQKYEWNLNKEVQYNQVIEVTPRKWLNW
ncbi:MAG TPA: pyridoxamine 5'-phosphate oxidase family protein [Anaerolineaceae bacterium]|nr:pyridoxamine 5'-phosphate oxidase family protein [Anaerolineaceae bacterium]